MNTALRLTLLGAAAMLALAACGSASSPAPSSSAAPATSASAAPVVSEAAPAATMSATPAPAGSAAAGTACGQDLAQITKTMRGLDHYAADGTMSLVVPMGQADPSATPLDVSATLRMEHQEPDRDTLSMKMSMPGLGDFNSTSIKIGTDEWTDSQGTGAWTHSVSAAAAKDSADIFQSLADAGLSQVDPATIPGAPDLVGTGCLIAFASQAAPTASPATGTGLDLTDVTHVLFRIDSGGRVESAAFLFDPTVAATGSTPTAFTLVFDYANPVSIQAPDPSTVTEASPAP